MKKLLLLLLVFSFSCGSDESSLPDADVIIDEALYKQTQTNNYTLKEASIEGNLLKVTIHSSGCDGSLWDVKLVDSGAIAESYPVQRYTKLALKNTEMCDAIVTRNFTFDITPLQVEDQLYLNLEGWDEKLHYDF